MSVKHLEQRLARLTGTRTQPGIREMIVIVPDDWTDDILHAYDAAQARGDVTAQADIIEEQTGKRPVHHTGGPPTVIELRMLPTDLT